MLEDIRREAEVCAHEQANEYAPKQLLVRDAYGNQSVLPNTFIDVVAERDTWEIIFFQKIMITTGGKNSAGLVPVAYIITPDAGKNWSLSRHAKNVSFMKQQTEGDKFFGVKDLWFSLEEPIKNDKGDFLLVIKQK
jgi:hypothetical protein